LPPGVLNIIHGGKRTVDFLCDNEDIKAISFVGSSVAGHQIHAKATAKGKRVQANLGAKNHCAILPDADKESVINALIAAAFGASGQRCMALSVAVFIGDSIKWLDDLKEKAAALKVSAGDDSSSHFGPMISPAALNRAKDLISSAIEQGADVILDGRSFKSRDYPKGNFLGPTIISNVATTMDAYKQEIFGPVLLAMQTKDLDEALSIINGNPHGNGCAIFTSSGYNARKFQFNADVGKLGLIFPFQFRCLSSASLVLEARSSALTISMAKKAFISTPKSRRLRLLGDRQERPQRS